MIDDDQNQEYLKYQALFEGQQSAILSKSKVSPEITSAISQKKLENATTRKSFQTPRRDKEIRRLPPGQSRTTEWPVLDLGDKPVIDQKEWSMSVGGLVENPIHWDWDILMAQPQSKITTDIHCVTAWSRFDNTWKGVSAKHLLSVVKPKPEAKFIVFHGYDGYRTNVPLTKFDSGDVMIAHHWQGETITREHGGPVRVVIPTLYFWKSAKWLHHIAFLEHDIKGYWETHGYHNDGDPWKEQRYE